MADSSKSKSSGGCLTRLLVLILLASSVGLAAALYFIVQPQDLSDIDGYGPDPKPVSARDMKLVLQNSIDRGYPVTLTEAEINQWLGRTLAARQGGLLADKVSIEGVWVRLEDGFAEVVIERKVMGKPFTVSMFLRIEQLQGTKGVRTEVQMHGGPFFENLPQPTRGGRFGTLVVPQGFLLLVLPAYRDMAGLFENEIHLGFEEMARITIEKGRLILDPRDPADVSGLPTTF